MGAGTPCLALLGRSEVLRNAGSVDYLGIAWMVPKGETSRTVRLREDSSRQSGSDFKYDKHRDIKLWEREAAAAATAKELDSPMRRKALHRGLITAQEQQ